MHEVEQSLRDHGCVYTDNIDSPPHQRVHLVLSSGKHSNGYVNIDPITPHPKLVKVFASHMLTRLPDVPLSDLLYEPRLAVIGPEKGVNAFLYNFAQQLDEIRHGRLYMKGMPQVFSIVVEKRKLRNGSTEYFIDREGHASLCDGAQLIGVEDVSTTGGSLGGALQVGIEYGGKPGAGVCIWNRGAVSAEDLGLPEGSFYSVVNHELPMWEAADCPLCDEEVPIDLDLAHGTRHQQEHPDYAGGWNHLLSTT